MITRKSGEQAQEKLSAEKSFQFGVQASNDSELEQAAESFGEAQQSFDLRGGFQRAAESPAMIAAHPSEEAESLLALGHFERQLGHLDQAVEAYLMAHRLYQALHQVQGLGRVALALGHIELQRTHLDYAAQHYQEAIDYLRAAADTTEIDALKSLANAERLLGSFYEAEVHCRLALEKYRVSEDVFGRIDALTDLGRIYLDAGRLDQASQTWIEALNLARSAEYEEGQGDVSLGLAEVDLRQNRVDQAWLEARAALRAYTVRRYDLGIANAERLLAAIYLRDG